MLSIPGLARKPGGLDYKRFIWDECHHSQSESWRRISTLYPNAQHIGLTATPERSDGRALGDTFQHLIVAAHYSELLADGYLTPCRVFAPTKEIEGGIALTPVAAYQRYTPGKKGFVFVTTVKQGEQVCAEFNALTPYRAELITGKTSTLVRESILERFRTGETKLIVNPAVLIEGFDEPSAEVCIVARACTHVGMYLQIAGRILRSFPGKTECFLLDLVGASLRHGMPTMDREYSLAGTAIRPKGNVPALRQCWMCGACMEASVKNCITCGTKFVPGVNGKPPKVHNLELREVYAGVETPHDAKTKELLRLLDRGDSLTAASKHHVKLFGERPDWTKVSDKYLQLAVRTMLTRGMDRGKVYAIVRSITGRYPK